MEQDTCPFIPVKGTGTALSTFMRRTKQRPDLPSSGKGWDVEEEESMEDKPRSSYTKTTKGPQAWASR
ncbi:hypothetical protein Y1Q_0008193 [Alligator mississippiensis]|uniref:Uncharacterized protein n=1 Tax=Alligator mississippiensis TaxID=8496 RepID=A0A151N161_ALLMI|nr:hypothetical protein Y1Q_0008193 [Alligator mississippiensis]